MVSPFSLISKSSNPFGKPSGIVPSGPLTRSITLTFIFHSSSSHQVSRILLSILADLKNVIVGMVVFLFPTLQATYTLGTVPSVPITTGMIVTFIFHSVFFLFPGKVQVFFSLFIYLNFHSVVLRDCKVYYTASARFFLSIICRSSLLARIRLSVCI